ncbi:hypothetical protein [Novosphingobium sp.]|uniref:hypothetical protein n=1 Tax=Novosphingobium sp. TaxID=1874826 RepID=UPI00286DE722|nr:hypothetical protein [Novosphingobium sp.]
MPAPSDHDAPQRPAPIEPLNRPHDRRFHFEAVTIALILIGTAIGFVAGWLELLGRAQP